MQAHSGGVKFFLKPVTLDAIAIEIKTVATALTSK
jgi:hypothetical protein